MAHKTSNLTRLPLELRDTIYEYVIGDITTLVLPKSTYNSSTTQSLQKKLPPCLFLNHQILLEATNAFIHRATLTLRELTLAHPSDLLFAIPSDAKFPNLTHLTFTHKQPHYSSSSASAHSIVHRCPQLQHLTIPFYSRVFHSVNLFFDETDVRFETDLLPIFTHETLLKVDILCYDKELMDGGSWRWPKMGPWTWFDKWWGKQESRIVLRVLLDPYSPYWKDVQGTWRQEGNIGYNTWAGDKA
jgi:hypothetical protein